MKFDEEQIKRIVTGINKQTVKQHEGYWNCCCCKYHGTLYDYKGLGVFCENCLNHVKRIVKYEIKEGHKDEN